MAHLKSTNKLLMKKRTVDSSSHCVQQTSEKRQGCLFLSCHPIGKRPCCAHDPARCSLRCCFGPEVEAEVKNIWTSVALAAQKFTTRLKGPGPFSTICSRILEHSNNSMTRTRFAFYLTDPPRFLVHGNLWVAQNFIFAFRTDQCKHACSKISHCNKI